MARRSVKIDEDRAARMAAQRLAWEARAAKQAEAERRKELAREKALAYAAELRAAGVKYRPSVRSIEAKACRIFKLTRADLRSNRRHRRTVFARQFVMYWSYRLTLFSLPQIGRLLGDRDHTTVLHGVRSYPMRRAEMGRFVRSIQHKEG